MSFAMQRLGERAFAHSDRDDDETEREYDRLRDLAGREAEQRNSCFERSQEAYRSGDGAAAKDLSNQGKRHAAQMDEYNRQASDFIFRANNAPGQIQGDEIDLHGQYVDEAERILEQRIRADRQRGVSHIYAIVGKGNHSQGGKQKLRPAVEKLCREMGLKFAEDEENEGRLLINLQGGEAVVATPHTTPQGQGQGQGQYPGGHGGQQHGQQHYGGQQQQHHGQHHQQQHQQQGQQDGDIVHKMLRKLEKHCCVVM